MLRATKSLPYTVVYGDPKLLLFDPGFQNTRDGQSILFGKNRLLELMTYKEVEGFKVIYTKSSTDAYEGIQVMMVAVNKRGETLVDIEAATEEDADAVHGSIWGMGYPNQPEPEYFHLCCIDWSYILLLILQELLNKEMLTPDAGCPDCGPWDEDHNYYFP